MRLVGREREQALLRDRLDQAVAGRGGLVLVSGEPGIGLRSLLADLTAYAVGVGVEVHRGRALPGSGPYRALSEALLPLVRRGRVQETPELRPFRSALGRLLPGWADPQPPEPGIDPALLLGEGVLRLLLAIPAPACLLRLDDLDQADPDTLAVVDHLAAAVAALPVLVVTTHTEPPLVPALARLPGTRLRLSRLTDADLGAVVDQLRPVPPAVRAAIVLRAEGLPVVAAALAASLPSEPEPDGLPVVPESYAALVAGRLAGLDADGRRLLAAAAALDDPHRWSLVPELAELDPAAAAGAYHRALALGLLVTEAGQLRWPHPLVPASIRDALLPPEREQLNRRAAELLLGLDSKDGDIAAAERLIEAGDRDRAAGLLLRLAVRALSRGGLRSAESLLERAAALGRPVEVAIVRVELLTVAGRPGEALDGGTAVLDEATGDLHAELCLRLAGAAVTVGQWDRAEALVSRAGRADDPRSAILRADAAHGAGRVADAARLAGLGLDQARDGPPEVLCEALCVRARIERLTDPAAAHALFSEAAQLAGEKGLRAWRVEALVGVGTLELLIDESSPTLEHARGVAEGLGLLGQAARADILLADHAFVCDGPAAVAGPAQRLAERAALLRLPMLGFFSELLLALRDALTGPAAAVEARLRDLQAWTDLPPDMRSQSEAVRAFAALAAHDLPTAKARLDAAARSVSAHESAAPLLQLGLWPLVAALVDGPAEVARAVLRQRPGLLRRANRGALCYADAIVAGRVGDPRQAEVAFAAGEQLLAPVGWWHRFLRLWTSEAAIADGWGTPVPLLRADLAVFEQGGDHALARTCRDLLRRAGAPTRRGRGDAVVPPRLRARGITSRELDVLRLVEQGLTNATISQRLFCSPRTVETHVANLLLKSGAANRGELRGWAQTLTP